MAEEPDNSSLSITALPIGQGDAILIRWREGDRQWTCLVDGGSSWVELKKTLRVQGVEHLDLLVVTHLDSDHIAGLGDWIARDPTSFPKVDCYWGPALAAFERHSWLFGERCVKALARGRRLENGLRGCDPNMDILYPLEGFTAAPWGRAGPQIEVLSPPARLIKHLLTTDNIADLLTPETTPMGWLLEPEPQPDDDDGAALYAAPYAEGLISRVLDPTSLADVQPSPKLLDATALAHSVHSLSSIEPIFFGNMLFNNSSLVMWLDLPVGGRSYSTLLTGDLENWTYLVGRHRKGLQPDLLKAPHHGGRVYIEGLSGAARESADELHRYLRPKTVLVSSIGGHGLPHETTRAAWIRWGASVLCTCTRGREILVGPQPLDRCCQKNRDCKVREEAISIQVSPHGVEASHQACHSGFGDANAPPVIVHQQIVNPSPALEILGDLEMRRYLNWVEKELRSIHEKRVASGTGEHSKVVSDADLRTRAAAEVRKIGPLAAHLTTVLDVGMKRERLWSAMQRRHDLARTAYTRPTRAELDAFTRELREKGMVAWPDANRKYIGDRESFIFDLGHEGLAAWAHLRFGYPPETFRDLLLPAALAELSKLSWSILAHPKGGVLMVHDSQDIGARFERMVTDLRGQNESTDFPLLVAFMSAYSNEEFREQLQGLFETKGSADSSGPRAPADAWNVLDEKLRPLLETWSGSELERGTAWWLRNIGLTPKPTTFGTQAILLGGTNAATHWPQSRIQDWLQPTPAALEGASFTNICSYDKMLKSVAQHGLDQGLILALADKQAWINYDVGIEILLGSNSVRVSAVDLKEKATIYAALVVASFERLR